MPPRFYVPDGLGSDVRVRLPASEATHAARVLRLRVGATVQAFDGRGHEWTARIESVGRDEVVIETLGTMEPARETRVSLTLAQAVLKGRAFDAVVRDATMLGVAVVQPLVTTHTDVPASALSGKRAVSRWGRVAVASAKQSRRAVVPSVRSVATLETYLSGRPAGPRYLFVEPTNPRTTLRLETLAEGAAPEHATVIVGPEGGWTDIELDDATSHGCELMTLGSRTLRADAVPIAALSLLLFIWGEL
jgi:16S rRNA (uracil1498-N3)-methyltransferase